LGDIKKYENIETVKFIAFGRTGAPHQFNARFSCVGILSKMMSGAGRQKIYPNISRAFNRCGAAARA